MKILFADAFEQSGLDALTGDGHLLDYRPQLSAADLPSAVGEADVLVVRSTRVSADVFKDAGALGLVIRAGAGTNTIDLDAAAQRAVFVANVPGKNAVAVAELTMGLIMSLDRRIAENVSDARSGRWNKKLYSQASGIYGKTLGIVGLGQIGMAVAERARGFGVKVVTVARHRDQATVERMHSLDVDTVPDLATLFESSDIVSLHLPADSSTKRMIDATLLSRVKPGAIFINTSRGDVVDEEALLKAIDEKNLRVGIDVFEDEPSGATGEFRSALAQHPSVYTTHHIGASTVQAQEAIAEEVVVMIRDYARGRVRNAVNLNPPPPVGSIMIVRHFDRVGVLSAVLGVLRRAGLNVQEMQNQVFAGAGAAVASIHVEGEIPADAQAEVTSNPDVINVSIRPAQP